MSNNSPIFLSIIIPAYRERDNLETTCCKILSAFDQAGCPDVELIVLEDCSDDGSDELLSRMSACEPRIRPLINSERLGFGASIVKAFDVYRGEAICLTMADLSDSPEDMVTYYRLLKDGAECVFGSRFIRGGQVLQYPRMKLLINRLANGLIRLFFWIRLNDITGAFKAYRREVIEGISPILSKHFSITVEMPLKAIVRGYQYSVVPITWTNRRENFSNLNLPKQAPRYLYTVLCVWLEKWLVRGDYRRTVESAADKTSLSGL